jgi:hypothetical protein
VGSPGLTDTPRGPLPGPAPYAAVSSSPSTGTIHSLTTASLVARRWLGSGEGER